MSLETAQFIHQLNPSNPSGADRLKEGDDHIRLLKAALKNTFPGLTGPLDPSVTHTFLNGIAALLVPVGAISLWHGAASALPTGWALCDGSEVNRSDGTGKITTPDLRGRVPVGASEGREVGTKFGQAERTVTSTVAGSHTHTADTGEAGAHSHTVSGTIANSKTGVTVEAPNTDVDGGSSAKNIPRHPLTVNDPGHSHALTDATAASGGGHKHPVTIQQVDGHSHQSTINVEQPAIALHFIIKV